MQFESVDNASRPSATTTTNDHRCASQKSMTVDDIFVSHSLARSLDLSHAKATSLSAVRTYERMNDDFRFIMFVHDDRREEKTIKHVLLSAIHLTLYVSNEHTHKTHLSLC